MKRTLIFALVLAMLLSLCACARQPERSLELIQIETTDQETVTLTLPYVLFEGAEDFVLEDYLRENGFLSGQWQADGSAKVTMTLERQTQALEEVKQSVLDTFQAILTEKNTAYVKDITYNEDFSQVTMHVVREDFDKSYNLAPTLVAMVVQVYQAFRDVPHYVEISIADADTGEVFKTLISPDT